MYYCGWDGGATKTRICILDSAGTALHEEDFGPLNINGTSSEVVADTIRHCIDYMKKFPEGLEGCGTLVIGMAGISNPKAVEFITNRLQECGYTGDVYIKGDHEIALHGAIDGAGAILIAGTGSVCFLRDEEGRLFRCGGYGHLIDDEGSGYAIGRDILKAAIRGLDGRGPDTCLSELTFKHLSINKIPQLIAWLYSPETDKKQIAAVAPLLLSALDQGDSVAEAIAEKASRALAELVIGVFKRAKMTTGEVAMVGSIMQRYPLIRKRAAEIIRESHPNINLILPHHSPAYGAAKMAWEMFSK